MRNFVPKNRKLLLAVEIVVARFGIAAQRSSRHTTPQHGGIQAAGVNDWRTGGPALLWHCCQPHSRTIAFLPGPQCSMASSRQDCSFVSMDGCFNTIEYRQPTSPSVRVTKLRH